MSSKRRIRRRSCARKQRHVTPEAAYAARRALARATQGLERFDVYACRFCGGYHVGHSKRH